MYRLFSCKNWAAIAIAICFGTVAAASQPFPERSVTVLIGFSAGGVQDVAGRIVVDKVGDLAGVRFVVENRPGAGGALGIDRVATSQPDGYTIMLVPVDSLTVTPQILSLSRDPIADLYEDIAAEEKARATYQWLINLSDDPDINDSLRFLREREIVHSLRFREAVEILKEDNCKKKIF